MNNASFKVFIVLVTGLILSSCYVTAQGTHYLSLRARAVPVATVLVDPKTKPEVLTLLQRVAEVRLFAVSELVLRETFSTQVFDHNEIECTFCGGIFRNRQIIEHLDSTNPRLNR